MKLKTLSLLATAVLAGPAALAAPKSFSCQAFDYALTEIRFVESGESLHLSISSYALDSVIAGVKLPTSATRWHRARLELSIPLASCRFSRADRNLFRCDPHPLTAIAKEIPDPSAPADPIPLLTRLAWASFSLDKHSTETVDGGPYVQYLLDLDGYGDSGELRLQHRIECAAD